MMITKRTITVTITESSPVKKSGGSKGGKEYPLTTLRRTKRDGFRAKNFWRRNNPFLENCVVSLLTEVLARGSFIFGFVLVDFLPPKAGRKGLALLSDVTEDRPFRTEDTLDRKGDHLLRRIS